MEGRLTVPARAAARQALIAVLAAVIVLASSLAGAAPKDGKARAAFDEGIAAYQKGDYAGASAAFGRANQIENDVETLFAWAQAERQQDHCDKASELYQKLLESKLPDENKQVVNEKLDECKKILAARKPEPEPEPKPTTDPTPQPDPRPIDKPVDDPERKSRWKDPVGGVLLGAGVVGLAVGGVFLVTAKSADADAKQATKFFDVLKLNDKADSNGKIGVIASVAGGALIVAGIVRYATRSTKRTVVSGWLAPDGGGIAALGSF